MRNSWQQCCVVSADAQVLMQSFGAQGVIHKWRCKDAQVLMQGFGAQGVIHMW